MKILLCVDDDPVLQTVLDAMERFLDRSVWTAVTAAHVVPMHPLFLVGGDVPPSTAAESFLDEVAGRFQAFDIPVEKWVGSGDPAQEIARLADEREFDLIVMGALGERRDFLMGSVSQKVVAMAPCDVLVVRETEELSERAFRAVVAVDGSRGSEAGVDSFARKTRAREASIRLVHVIEGVPSLWDLAKDMEWVEHSRARHAQEILRRALEILGRRGLEAECEWRQGSPAAQILESAGESDADLIVVGSRGHSTLGTLMLGTITQRVLRHAPCTVLCARDWVPESAALSAGWSQEGWSTSAGLA